MYAQFWAATFCCILGCLPVVGADRSGSPESAVVVYLAAPIPQSALPYLRHEAQTLLESAGYSVEWRDASNSRGLDASNLVVVDFDGDCNAPATPSTNAAPASSGQRLAYAAVQDGAIAPFVRVDCGAVRATLASLADREAPARRSYLYGRAIGRLIAHELYHVLARTQDHAPAGVGKPCFTAADLVAERFLFEAVALDRFRRGAADSTDAADRR